MNYEFKSDVFVSGTSATISATAVMPVVPSTTTYIIPEQTLTASDFELYNQDDNFYVYRAPLTSSFPISDLYDGCKATLYYDMHEYKMEYHAADSVFTCDEIQYIGVEVTESGYYLLIAMAGEMPELSSATVSLSTSVPEVEPKWQTPSSGLPAYIDFSVTFYYDDSGELQSTFSVSDFVALGKVTGLCLVTNPDGISDIQNYSQMRSGVPPTVIGYTVWKGTIQPPLHSGMSFLDPLSASVISVENSGISTYEYRATANTTNGNLEWEAIV